MILAPERTNERTNRTAYESNEHHNSLSSAGAYLHSLAEDMLIFISKIALYDAFPRFRSIDAQRMDENRNSESFVPRGEAVFRWVPASK